MNDNDEFKCDLIKFLEKRINHSELRDKFGCSIEFIAEGMIDSISTSIRLSSIAKRMDKETDVN